MKLTEKSGRVYYKAVPDVYKRQDQKRNWSTGSLSFKNSGKDLHQISFLTGSCITALTGLSPVKKNLDIFFAERKTCGTAVENGTDSLAVRFSPGGNHEFFSE